MRGLMLVIMDLIFEESRKEGGKPYVSFHFGLILLPVVVIVLFCIDNMSVYAKDVLLITFGLWMNRVVMYSNDGRMPVRTARLEDNKFWKKHVPMTNGTHLKFLGDILGFGHCHASVGDILILSGVVISASRLMGWF